KTCARTERRTLRETQARHPNSGMDEQQWVLAERVLSRLAGARPNHSPLKQEDHDVSEPRHSFRGAKPPIGHARSAGILDYGGFSEMLVRVRVFACELLVS